MGRIISICEPSTYEIHKISLSPYGKGTIQICASFKASKSYVLYGDVRMCNDPNFQINISFLSNQIISNKSQNIKNNCFQIHNINILIQTLVCPIKSNVGECMSCHQALPLPLDSKVPETNQQTVS